jgi:hypothetical protein
MENNATPAPQQWFIPFNHNAPETRVNNQQTYGTGSFRLDLFVQRLNSVIGTGTGTGTTLCTSTGNLCYETKNSRFIIILQNINF